MAQVLYIVEPGKIKIRDEPTQKLRPDQARVQMLCSGISHGTEMNIYTGRNANSFPARSGYSAVGEVIETGPEFTKAAVGDRIFAYASHATEFVISEGQPVYRLPEGLDPKCGIFTALAGVAYNGVLESQVALGETTVVFGLGVVGLCASFLARRAGSLRVLAVDPIAARRKAGLRVGADAVLDPTEANIAERIAALNDGQLADVVIETSGSVRALNDALKIIQNQSTIVALSWYSSDAAGLDLTKDFHHKRVNIRVAQGGSVPLYLSSRWSYERRVRSTMKLLPEMPLESLITHRIPFEEAQRAYDLVRDQPDQCIQVMLKY